MQSVMKSSVNGSKTMIERTWEILRWKYLEWTDLGQMTLLSAQERLIMIIKTTRSWPNNSLLSVEQLLIMRMNWKRSSKTTRLSGKERQHWSNSPLQCGSTANNNPKHTCDQFSYYCLLAYLFTFVFFVPYFLKQCVHDRARARAYITSEVFFIQSKMMSFIFGPSSSSSLEYMHI